MMLDANGMRVHRSPTVRARERMGENAGGESEGQRREQASEPAREEEEKSGGKWVSRHACVRAGDQERETERNWTKRIGGHATLPPPSASSSVNLSEAAIAAGSTEENRGNRREAREVMM